MSQILLRHKRKAETVSIRMSGSLRASLEDEARELAISLNALVTQILTKHDNMGRHLGKLKLMPVSKDSLREVFKRMSKESIEDAARVLGSGSAREHILFMFRQANLDTVIQFLDFWGSNFNALDHYCNGRRHFFTMRHDVSFNYSVFVKEYISSMMQTIAPRPIEFDISPNSVTFNFEA